MDSTHQITGLERRTVSMYGTQWNKVQQLAARHYDGNVSLALRRIVDAYLDGIAVNDPNPAPVGESK